MSSSENFDDVITKGMKVKEVLPKKLCYGRVINPQWLPDDRQYDEEAVRPSYDEGEKERLGKDGQALCQYLENLKQEGVERKTCQEYICSARYSGIIFNGRDIFDVPLDTLITHGRPSPFGNVCEGSTQYDESVRKALELTTED